MKSIIKYAIYVRKSTESEDRQVQSIEAQLHELKKIAERDGLKVVRVFKESKSAKTPYQREQFTELMKLINKGELSGILTWQINRLSRNPSESGMLQQLLQDGKILQIRTSDRTYEPDDNAVVFSVEGAIANQFIMDLRKNVKRGIAAKLRSGGISGLAMAGYVNDRVNKIIVPDPIRYAVVRKAWDMMLTGEYSVPEVLKAMNEWGYTTLKHKKMGGGPMSRNGLYNIFKNPRYAGWIPDPHVPGEFVKKVSYPPMVTVEEYDKVQELLGDKGRPRLCQSKRFALRGLIRCGGCNCLITAEEHKKKLANGSENVHRYYHCTRKSKERICTQRYNIKEKDLFAQVDALLDEYELSPQLYEWGMEALAEMADKEIAERNDLQISQFDTIKDVENQLDRLLDMAVKGLIDQAEYDTKSKSLKKALKDYQKAQTETAERTRNWYEFVGKTLETLTDASEKFVTGDLSDKAEILLAIGQNPILLDKTLVITPNKWLIPVKESAKAIREELAGVRTDDNRLDEKALLDRESELKKTWYGILNRVRTVPIAMVQ